MTHPLKKRAEAIKRPTIPTKTPTQTTSPARTMMRSIVSVSTQRLKELLCRTLVKAKSSRTTLSTSSRSIPSTPKMCSKLPVLTTPWRSRIYLKSVKEYCNHNSRRWHFSHWKMKAVKGAVSTLCATARTNRITKKKKWPNWIRAFNKAKADLKRMLKVSASLRISWATSTPTSEWIDRSNRSLYLCRFQLKSSLTNYIFSNNLIFLRQ